MQDKIIWALLDERQGNTAQTIGVAEALGLPYERKNIIFNPWIKLPNFLLTTNRIGISNPGILTPPWPDIVIACARRLGIVASYIKHRNPACFLAQVQWPGSPYRQFDLIAAPLHDNPPEAPNIITTLGAPHCVTQSMLTREAERWREKLSAYPAPRIAMLVGGSARGKAFSTQHAERLAQFSSALAHKMNAALLITTSRRTGAEATQALARHVTVVNHFHAWQDGGKPEDNPFYGYLGLADAVIVTGDSISMCSEACATGKPVYIYADPDFVPRKHQSFIDELFRRKLAYPLLESSNPLPSGDNMLNEALLIAAEIRKRTGI